MKRNRYKWLIFTGTTIIILIIVILSLARPFRISGNCMEPAIMNGQLCFLNQISPYLRQYKIDDIVLFEHEKKVWISRIVAMENDTIQISEGNVVVNGNSLQNPKIHRSFANWEYGTYAINKPFLIPSNHVFVLSDNLSAQHDDSRVFGPISKSSILGIIWSV